MSVDSVISQLFGKKRWRVLLSILLSVKEERQRDEKDDGFNGEDRDDGGRGQTLEEDGRSN